MIETIVKKKFKSILCLDGELPDKEVLEEFRIPIIAADGAANKLIEKGLDPDIIIGDLDSFNSALRTKAEIISAPSQDVSDFQKATEYISNYHLFPSLVMGISGGYIDHILNNVAIFTKSDFVLYSSGVVGVVVRDTQYFELPVGTKISFFGIPHCKVLTQGMKWELNNVVMNFFEKSFCFNRTVLPSVRISVLEGNCLVFIYNKQIVDAGM